MSGRSQAGTDSSLWQVYVCEAGGPVNPARVFHVAGWNAMVGVVRREIEQCGQHGDTAAKTDAADLLDWLESNYQTRDYSLRLTFFHVGHDAVCVLLRERAGGAA